MKHFGLCCYLKMIIFAYYYSTLVLIIALCLVPYLLLTATVAYHHNYCND